MSTKARTLETARGPVFGPKEWGALAMVALMAVAALVMSVLALQRPARTNVTSVAVPHAAAGAGARALARIAERSEPVTGTGPGLVTVANNSIQEGIYESSEPVTGTGPGLAVVGAERNGIDSTQITGTGPDLAVVGARAEHRNGARAESGGQRSHA